MANRRKTGKRRFGLKKQRKLIFVFAAVVLCLVGLNGRIMKIQAQKGDEYKKTVLSQKNYLSTTIPFRRGDIKDRNGNLLATSQKVYNVILDCREVNSKDEYKEPTIRMLCGCFPQITEDTIRQALTDKPKSQYTILAKKVSYDEMKKFKDSCEKKDGDSKQEKEKKQNVKGIWFEEDFTRSYPNGSLACDIIGYTSSGNVGTWGIEENYDSNLDGINGRSYGYLNSDSETERVIKNATDGDNIISTIDINIQKIVEEKMLAFNESHRNEARQGIGSTGTAVIVMNPNNGEILAEANYPFFDLNNPRDLVVSGMVETTEQAATISEEDGIQYLNRVWRNYCISNTYEPGSTAKPFTVAMGLETGKLNGNETYFCDGSEHIGKNDIHCVKRSGHGQETIAQAIMNSCNDALMQISRVIGVETFTKYQSLFGFGKKTTIDLPAEGNASNLMFNKDNMTEVDLATNSFGQNFNVTMTQLSAAFASLINGGYYYQPHVVKKITDYNGSTIKNVEKKLLRQTVSKETSDIIKGYLNDTVMSGTARSALVEGYTMGGKTGTAEKLPRKEKKFVLSFIGYAPADNPEVLIYVVIDEPNVADQAHSSFATVLAKEIMTEVLPYMNIFPATEEGAQENVTGQEGESVDEAEAGQSIFE